MSLQKQHNILSASLPVMEAFHTLQGEGFHAGKAAYFIRLGGCDVGCVWCDVKESWDASKHPNIEIKKIVEQALKYPSQIVVITGGEPLMHDCTILTKALQEAGFATHLETSGAYPITGNWDWICVSPKKFKPPLYEVVQQAHELKAIVFNKTDFEWAEQYAAKTNSGCKLFLQPEWEKSATILPLVIDYIKAYPQWRLSLQTHKYIDIP